MSHFYGTMKGTRGMATRCGTKASGMTTVAASWNGAIRTEVFHDAATGQDRFRILETRWHGAGTDRVIAEGIIGGES